MMPQPFRVDSRLPVGAVQTYQVVSPLATHFRPASCAEVDCPNLEHGWRTVVDETTDLGRQQAHYIRKESGRKFQALADGGLTTFIFEAGQACFAQHQVRLDRPEHYLVRAGDWRGNPQGTPARQHANADDWIDDFANHQQALADRIQRG